MTKPASALYQADLTGIAEKLAGHIARGLDRTGDRPLVFFRADDIGIPSRGFAQLIECFRKHRLPLCLATVPAWLTEDRLGQLHRLTGQDSSQWCWHQHGRLHRNFETGGKKQEFGPARTKGEIHAGLKMGRQRLEQLLGRNFYPVFTPPWNRCSGDTLQVLVDLEFKAVSRSLGARPAPLPSLPDYQVNVDLHTRKETTATAAVDIFLTELEQGIASGLCGIMLHHQRMNRAALHLLDLLLEGIQRDSRLVPVTFSELYRQ